MRLNELPFNIFIMDVSQDLVRSMRVTNTTEIFETGTRNFNRDGLFSVETYGTLGSPERDGRFSYTNLNTTIFHPLIYKRLGTLKRLYTEIIEGTRYAIFDEEKKDFMPADELSGQTGFAFFVKHFPSLVISEGDSEIRNLRVRLINENRNKAMMDKILIMPAGLRDIIIEPGGRTSEDEINKYYRAIISIASSISGSSANKNDPIINYSRLQLQRNFNEIFESIFNMIKGKKGFALSKWASRKVMHGTANVITPMNVGTDRLGSIRTPVINDVQLGLYQVLKAVLPKSRYYIRNGWVGQVFSGNTEDDVRLTDPKTLRAVLVKPSPESITRWTTKEGIDGEITRYKILGFRQRPIMVDGYYLGLLYAGPQGWRFFADINELPEGFDKKYVYPINMTSLYYLSGYQEWHKMAGIVTRYPVTGPGSTYIGNIYCKTTQRSQALPELDENWRRLGTDFIANEFPDQSPKATHYMTLSPHPSRIAPLGADYDGDRCTFTAVYAKDSLEEFEQIKSKKEWYVSARGSLALSADVDNLDLVLRNITGGEK